MYNYTLKRRKPTFNNATHVGNGVYLGEATPPIQRERSFSAPPIFVVLLYLCAYTL